MKRFLIIFICILGISFSGSRMYGMAGAAPPTFTRSNYLTGPGWGGVHNFTHIEGSVGTPGTDQDSMEKIKWYGFYTHFFYDIIQSYFKGLVSYVKSQGVVNSSFGSQNNQNIATFFGNNKSRTYGILLHHPQAGANSLGFIINSVASLSAFANANCATGSTLQQAMSGPPYNIAVNYNSHFSYEWFAKISNELAGANAIVYNQSERTYAGLLLFLLGMMKKVGLLAQDVNSQAYFTQRQKNMYVNSFKDLFNFIADFYVSTFREYAISQGAERTGWQLWRYTKNMFKIATVVPAWRSGLQRTPQLSALVEALKPANAFEVGVASQVGNRIDFIDDRVYKESHFWRIPSMPGLPRVGSKTAIAAGLGAAALGGYVAGRYYAPEELGSAAYRGAGKALGFIPKAVETTTGTIYKIATSKVLSREEYNDLLKKIRTGQASKEELNQFKEMQRQQAAQQRAVKDKETEEAEKRRVFEQQQWKQQQQALEQQVSATLPENTGPSLLEKGRDLWEKRKTWFGESGSKPPAKGTSSVWDRIKRLRG